MTSLDAAIREAALEIGKGRLQISRDDDMEWVFDQTCDPDEADRACDAIRGARWAVAYMSEEVCPECGQVAAFDADGWIIDCSECGSAIDQMPITRAEFMAQNGVTP